MLTFTAFDKAILAAILGPLIVLGTNWLNGQPVDKQTLIAAVVAAALAGAGVYWKGNKEVTA